MLSFMTTILTSKNVNIDFKVLYKLIPVVDCYIHGPYERCPSTMQSHET